MQKSEGLGNQQGSLPVTGSSAYLIGAYLGDGHCRKDGYAFMLTSMDEDVVNRVSECAKDVVGKPGTISKSTIANCFNLVVCSKELVSALAQMTSNRERIPRKMMTAPKPISFEVVSGLMDTDGFIAENKFNNKDGTHHWRYNLGIGSTSRWLEDLRSLLCRLDVRVGNPVDVPMTSKHRKQCRKMFINLHDFCKGGFYFHCDRKQSRLERYRDRIYRPDGGRPGRPPRD